MKTLFLAAAAVLAIGAGAAHAESGEVYSWDQPVAQPAGQVVKAPMTTAAVYNASGAQYSVVDSNG